MRTRRRFSAEFKAKVALEAIKGHRRLRSWPPSTLHPTPIAPGSARRSKLAQVFVEKGTERERSRDGEITKLHAKIVSLLWTGFFVKAFHR